MKTSLTRRDFMKSSTGLGVAAAAGFHAFSQAQERPVRIGFVGTGDRGTSMLKVALGLEGVEIPAVCDINPERLARAQALVEQAGRPKPEAYGRGPEDYKRLVERPDLDAVYTATPWRLHTPVMVATMQAAKYGGTEMPACDGLDQAWHLVETSEKTHMPCMLMENYTYFRNTKMVLNMVRQGLFGDLSHCECGYQHDTRYVTIGADGQLLWRAYERALDNTGNRYPTHAIGPVSQWIDINRGNRFEYLVSMSSRSQGLNYYAAKKFGPDHPNAKRKYTLGDVNTSLIRASNGITVTLYYDPQTPRPIDFIYRIQGTKGIYSGTLSKIYLEDFSPKSHEWEDIEKYQQQYDHPLWKKYGSIAQSSGHGGSDYLCFRDFVMAVRNRTDVPVDVYDAATWSIITELTEQSVTHKSQPVDFPDFTRGQWQTRKPKAIETI